MIIWDDDEIENPECIEDHTGNCAGPVEFRMSLSGTGQTIPRCDHHWMKRLDLQEEINERYGSPDSDIPPPWFDPTYCGESWDGE